MKKYSVRLSSETIKALQAEAKKSCMQTGSEITVSDLIRRCIEEKLMIVSEKIADERATLTSIKNDTMSLSASLKKLVEILKTQQEKIATSDDIERLVQTIRILAKKGN